MTDPVRLATPETREEIAKALFIARYPGSNGDWIRHMIDDELPQSGEWLRTADLVLSWLKLARDENADIEAHLDIEKMRNAALFWECESLRAQVAKLEAENKELKEPEWFIDVVDGETYESVDILLDDFAQPWKPRHIEGARHAGGFFAARVWSDGNDGEGGGESVILSGPTAEDVQSQIDALNSRGNENG